MFSISCLRTNISRPPRFLLLRSFQNQILTYRRTVKCYCRLRKVEIDESHLSSEPEIRKDNRKKGY